MLFLAVSFLKEGLYGVSSHLHFTIRFYFNIIGTVLFLSVIYIIKATAGISFWNDKMNMGSIANFHTFFNIVVTIFFIPFHKLLEKLAVITIRNTESDSETHQEKELSHLNTCLKNLYHNH